MYVCVCLLAVSLQVHVRHMPTAQNTHLGQNWLADLTAAWKEAGLWITRAKVRAAFSAWHSYVSWVSCFLQGSKMQPLRCTALLGLSAVFIGLSSFLCQRLTGA
jgi:hypothetical protein